MEKIEIERKNGMVSLSLCGEVLKCETCTNVIRRLNKINESEILEEFENENSLIQIKISFLPTSNTKEYFSFDGIRKILKEIFQLKENQNQGERAIVKIYFFKKELHLEVFFFDLLSEPLQYILKEMQKSIPFKDINCKFSFKEYHLPNGLKSGTDIFEVPMNVGQGTLINNKFLQKLGYSNEQLKEMDYFIGTGLKIFYLSEIFDNSIFKLEKKMSQENNIHKVMNGHFGFFD